MTENHPKLKSTNPLRLREARVARGMSIQELADRIGVTRQAVSQYELGHTIPKADVFANIVRSLGLPANYFLQEEEPINIPWGTTFFRKLASANKRSRDMLLVREQWLHKIYKYFEKFFELPCPDFIDMDIAQTGSENLDVEEIEKVSQAVRRKWNLGNGPISNMVQLLELHGVIVTRVTTEVASIDAFSQWQGKRPIVFLGSDKNSCVRSRFDAAHELGHLVLHKSVDADQLNEKAFHDRIEKEAYLFAGAFLLPRETFLPEVLVPSISHFTHLKKRWKVSIAAMIMRCEQLGIFSEYQRTSLWKQLSMYGRKREPLDDELEVERPVLLKQCAEMLIKSGRVTGPDIVSGLVLGQTDVESICCLDPGTLAPKGHIVEIKLRK